MERSQGERGRVRCLPGYHEQAGSAIGRKTTRKNVAKRRKYWGQKHLQQNSKKIRCNKKHMFLTIYFPINSLSVPILSISRQPPLAPLQCCYYSFDHPKYEKYNQNILKMHVFTLFYYHFLFNFYMFTTYSY